MVVARAAISCPEAGTVTRSVWSLAVTDAVAARIASTGRSATRTVR